MKLPKQICATLILPELAVLGLTLLLAVPVWSQASTAPSQQPLPTSGGLDNSSTSGNSGATQDNTSDDRMMTPPPVSGQNYPTATTSEERSNYLRGGVNFTSAYSDNAIGPVDGHPESDVSYSVAPSLALDTTRPREHLLLTYAPGFTFYQRTSGRNEADQSAAIIFQYRLSPHVSFSAGDNFLKSSSVFNQPDLGATGAVSGGAQSPNFSVIAPVADRLSNAGNVSLTYQFALNGMIGASGSFSNLHYPNTSQVPGLNDASSQGGSVFYSLRASKMNYLGVTYQYQRLLSYPAVGLNETQTHTVFLFYTLYPTARFSISFFGGPQYSDTLQPPLLGLQLPAARAWTPAAGGSFSWQGRLNSLAVSYSHVISGGGGLMGAVKMNSASASVRQQITKTFSASAGGGYTQNNLLGSPLFGATNGHTITGIASLQKGFGQHLNLQLAYTRVHQDYSSVAVLASTPNTNRESVSVSYQFARPLGR